jgi:FkbM family methyltransferase
MNITEKLSLYFRAYRYRYKHDPGGISFIQTSVVPGNTVLDIGSHKAGYLYFMARHAGPGGKVIAFEPQEELYRYLIRIKNLCKWDYVHVENIAISDDNGMATLFVPENKRKKDTSCPGATIARSFNASDYVSAATVVTETLDSYCSRMKISPDFIKIDVEGNELNVLRGALATLKRCSPKIHIEIEARHAGKDKVMETFLFFKENGYTGHIIHGNKYVPLSSFSLEKHQNLSNKAGYCNNFTFEKMSLKDG